MSIIYRRDNDVISGEKDLEVIYSIKKFPVFVGTTEQTSELDFLVDLNFQISKSTGMVQINPLIDLTTVYQTTHNPGTIGKTWKNHHKAFSEFLLKFIKNSVLEIGGYSGVLANNCFEQRPDVDWTIIDPHAKPINNINIINSFFDEKFISENKFDIIVHSHLIEHIIDINLFLKLCFQNLSDDGYMIFSLPNLSHFIEQRLTNSLNFEHTFFIDEYFLAKLFQQHGFELVEKTYYEKSFNIFYCVRKTNPKKVFFDEMKVCEYKNKFKSYFDDINNFIEKINNLDTNDQNVFMFGGHVTSQFLISMGLNQKLIKYLLDNDTNKQGKRLYGTELYVKSPEIIKNYNNPKVILKNSFFDEEISNQLFEINKDVQIITF